MGKAVKWLRWLLSFKKSPAKEKEKKSKWAFSNPDGSSVKFKNRVEDPLATPYFEALDGDKHRIAVAAATAAVAEAAVAAAHAAAEVARLTSGRYSGDLRAVLAAVKIQAAFRAYLARRALRALKGLVKLQALVRGHIVRKQSADMLRRLQALVRIQARASAHRSCTSESSNGTIEFSNSHHPRNHLRSVTGNGNKQESSQLASRWLNHWMEHCTWNHLHESGRGDDERCDKILEIDTWKPCQNTSRGHRKVPTRPYSAWNSRGHDWSRIRPPSRLSSKPNPNASPEEVLSVISSKFPPYGDEVAAWTTNNSPRLHSASSRPSSKLRGPFTLARSECSRSLFGDYPSYMAYTESSRAKVRSSSAPKQRMQFGELGWGAKFGHRSWESAEPIPRKGSASPAKDMSNSFLYTGRAKRRGTVSGHGL